MVLDPKIWGPHYWFFLHTVALNYPLYPNEISKKKYYDFIENFSLFIPIPDIANSFSNILDEFPVTPYYHYLLYQFLFIKNNNIY